MARLILKNGLLALPEGRSAVGDLEIANGRIVRIGLAPKVDSPAPSAVGEVRTIDCTGKLILPGLVNAHGHTAMTLVRGLGSGLPLQRWLEEAIFPVEAKMTPQDIRAGALWGALEMLAGGTTLVADMYDFPADGAAAFRAAGLKANICRVGLNFVPDRLQDCVDFTRAWQPDRVWVDLCIHSEYLTDETFCRNLAAANRELKRPVHFHVSETRKEHDECLARHGKTPIAYLADTGLLDFGGYAAHGVWCTDDDFRIMAERGVTLVHNPTSNMKLGSGFARVPRAVELGVNVALGTDGCASNDNLDLFEEMHLAALVHKGVSCDPTCLSAAQIFAMATANGARALGRVDTGTLAVGRAADLCVIDLDRPHLQPCLDLYNLIVYSMHASDVVMTLVDGEVVYERGHYPRVDQAAARDEFRAAVARLFPNFKG